MAEQPENPVRLGERLTLHPGPARLSSAAGATFDLLDRRRLLESVYRGDLLAVLGTDGGAVVFRRETEGSA